MESDSFAERPKVYEGSKLCRIIPVATLIFHNCKILYKHYANKIGLWVIGKTSGGSQTNNLYQTTSPPSYPLRLDSLNFEVSVDLTSLFHRLQGVIVWGKGGIGGLCNATKLDFHM